MKTDGLTVLVNRTYNLGNYESVKIEVGLSISLDAEDKGIVTLEGARDKAFEWISKSIKEEHEKSYKKS